MKAKCTFEAIQVSTDFLEHDPHSRDATDHYRRTFDRVHKLKVVNDAAERGISMAQKFNSIITKQSKEDQYLLPIVERHCQQFSVSKKSIVVEKLSGI